MEIKPIAYIYTDFKEKFGIPRQSGRNKSAMGKIVFEKEFAVNDAFKGIEQFSHLWLIFDFSKSHTEKFNPTVRPPRLGGNKRVGVFATRSPFRPNSLGLSVVKLESIDFSNGVSLMVSGVDLLDGTPIYDIKPYIPYADNVNGALGGFSDEYKDYALSVIFPEELISLIPKNKHQTLIDALKDDPRPSYIENDERVYSMKFSCFDISFKVSNQTLEVIGVKKI
ncbi:MAG: tRNA (N6-threonylcarbamoyladenosine(37)-N6)-methyltransferase TrmO [Clostridia bacterium]|nr:tRNA (N6-threonylcarbamoyladenosine(37)-N6)-methyltransferase TrmO [Clostridia bacterium]